MHRPTPVRAPPLRAAPIASSTSRVLPTPASPPISTNWPSPIAAPVMAAAIRSSSADLPTKSGLETLIATNGLSAAEAT
jgi:hypothetical protein